MDTEKVCGQCGKHCVPAQSYCPKCGSMLPGAIAVARGLATTGRMHKLIINKGAEEQIFECENEEQAFDEALPWVMKGYIARIADEQGIVKCAQALSDGHITVFKNDASEQPPVSAPHATGSQSIGLPQKPRWRFW